MPNLYQFLLVAALVIITQTASKTLANSTSPITKIAFATYPHTATRGAVVMVTAANKPNFPGAVTVSVLTTVHPSPSARISTVSPTTSTTSARDLDSYTQYCHPHPGHTTSLLHSSRQLRHPH